MTVRRIYCGVRPGSGTISVIVLEPWVIPSARYWPEHLDRWKAYAGRTYPAGAQLVVPVPLYVWWRRVQPEFIGRLLVPRWMPDGRQYFSAAHQCTAGARVARRQPEIEAAVAKAKREQDAVPSPADPRRPARPARPVVKRFIARPCGGCMGRKR